MQETHKKSEEHFASIDKVRSTRVLCLLSSLLFLVFSFVDMWTLPSSLPEALLIRGIVITGLVFTYYLTYTENFINYHDPVLFVIFMLAISGMISLIYLASPEEHAYNTYFIGLVLALMTLFSWTYLKLSLSLLISGITLGAYFVVESVGREPQNKLALSLIFANLFFILTAGVIGMVARMMRDRFLKENYALQKKLYEKVEKKSEEIEVQSHRANHDPLTGLPNRRYAKEKLDKFLQQAISLDMSVAIMYLDLNGFKKINDIYGHKAGDSVLKIIARRLQSCMRSGDIVSRLGGDEFAIGLIVEKKELHVVDDLRKKIEKAIYQPIAFEGNQLQLSASIGVASYPVNGNKVNVLLDIADKRMYQQKQTLKNREKLKTPQISDEKRKDTRQIVIFPG